ncbi:hypothetical protein FT663_01616 [Candidozyma haemuli var. vulneris]|uniref:Thioredoxin domain-containing protein n=1 Tax=Candidozyma haemuli TaxID=45357 RepID=A0A2V1B153_9ASCO|nr:hypothetical protein CXQ85_004118 [[Candida] haemuloni]KAF3994116.1 hypothetical protein FT663_01616 [[Candida] haemuloni var. vulneris]KAF3994282.1 hypothetical protein FT662_00151 [[Candida] haemuloni var. vulneris]PVH23824.1 hypothetical protein CXQ85_004118 [[Candida] haemuloni]
MLPILRRQSLVKAPLLSSRLLHSSRILWNQQKPEKPSNETEKLNDQKSQPNYKKRPLSRVAIGGSSESKKLPASKGIEFAAWRAVLVLIIGGGIFTWWFSREKEKLRLQKEVEAKRGVGKPLIGGNFTLVDEKGNTFTQENLKNNQKKFSILYFGFTHCPDVCPDELDKLGDMLEDLKQNSNIELQPVFITCDPARDSSEVINQYLEDFHPSIIGLTGTYEQVKNVCKKFRVYFSTPPDVKPGQDYLVDHSIFFYLMDCEGNFVDVIGREVDAKSGAEKIKKYVESFVPEAEREARKSSWLGFLYK